MLVPNTCTPQSVGRAHPSRALKPQREGSAPSLAPPCLEAWLSVPGPEKCADGLKEVMQKWVIEALNKRSWQGREEL